LSFTYRFTSPLEDDALMQYDIASETNRVISESSISGRVEISGDGQWLTYRAEVARGSYGLLLYNIADGTERVVTDRDFISGVGWSPDSVWLTGIQGDSERPTHFELRLFNVTTSEELSYSFDAPTNQHAFAWSPDGPHIALAVQQDLVREYRKVYILSVPELEVVGSVYPMLSRVELIWSPSGRWLILSAVYGPEFALVDISVQPLTMTQVSLGSYPRYFWSPNETYLGVYYDPGDLATWFTLLNNQGEVVVDGESVPSSLYEFEPQHGWIDADHFLFLEWDSGFDGLMLVDARTGERQMLFTPISTYALSSDREHVALIPYEQLTQVEREIKLYDWTGETFDLVQTVTTLGEPRTMVWRADSSELIVLFDDHTLQAYSADSWHTITTLPDSAWSIALAPCFG
jgi:hypothetical protein